MDTEEAERKKTVETPRFDFVRFSALWHSHWHVELFGENL